MRLFFYLHHFPGDGGPLRGGTAKAVHGLASGLAACGADVTVLCAEATERTVVSPHGYSICSLPHQRYPWPSGALSNYVGRSMRGGLAILNGMFHPSLFRLSRLLLKWNVPYVVAPHLPYSEPAFQKNAHLKWPYWYLFERRLLRDATAIQVLSEDHIAPLRRRRISTPVIVAPNGFDPDDVCDSSALTWRTKGDVRLLSFGRIDAHHKGLDLLLTAFDQVAPKANVTLTIQGPDEGDRRHLKRQADELASAHRITFADPDFITPPTSIMNRYDVFCLPSRYDGFGLAALESMLAGRVLLVSSTAGIASHVAESGCGVVVTPRVETVRDGLFTLLEKREVWPEMGRAGRRYALDRLSWESIAAAARSKYSALAKGKALQER